jgi:hypothetical protein
LSTYMKHMFHYCHSCWRPEPRPQETGSWQAWQERNNERQTFIYPPS